MKNLHIKISDFDYERFRFEALIEGLSVRDIVKNRVFHKPFCEEVEKALSDLMEKEIKKF